MNGEYIPYTEQDRVRLYMNGEYTDLHRTRQSTSLHERRVQTYTEQDETYTEQDRVRLYTNGE